MTLSVFDIFKVGIGPSSSHTMGPMRAAREFALGLKRDGLLGATRQVAVRLYGSLAFTGVGHGTDRAVLAGLEGAQPETVDPDSIEPGIARIRQSGRIRLLGEHEIAFDEPMQLLFMRHEQLPRHSNGMRFTALDASGKVLREEEYYSVGGGFVVRGDEEEAQGPRAGSRTAISLHLRRRTAGALPRAWARDLRTGARQRVQLGARGTGAGEAAAPMEGHASLRGARLPPERAPARGAEVAPARAADVPHARREYDPRAAGCNGLGE